MSDIGLYIRSVLDVHVCRDLRDNKVAIKIDASSDIIFNTEIEMIAVDLSSAIRGQGTLGVL